MKRFAVIAIMLFFLAVAAGLAGARINTTPSLPLGLYWLEDSTPGKGSLVLFCPPDQQAFGEAKDRGYLAAGLCDSGTQPLMKRIAAIEGDQVMIAAQGTVVNGKSLLNSAQVQADPEGRPLPNFKDEFTVVAGQVLLMSEYSPLSFDSRYFGPVDEGNLLGVLEPVWTFSR
jgi:conjugative transfer signal peptidase TraF